MAIKITEKFLKEPAKQISGTVLYSDKYAVTSYAIPKNGVLTVIPNFYESIRRHTSYIVLKGLVHIESPMEEFDVGVGDAIEIDNDTPYFLV